MWGLSACDGPAGTTGGVAGDLYVTVEVSDHRYFTREGADLHMTLPVAVHEAAFGAEDPRPFPQPREPITPRIRQLADTLAVEMVNDRFLSTERLEFMLQELVLSIVETYLARRRASSRLWHGSRFRDSRIRQAIALLREHPNKEVNMDDLANQVGLSRSRFYDLFQVCTGFSPRTYLDMLCVEAAISRLSHGQDKISEVSAELGFSAQSNFTRFFLNQVGVPPSEYRKAATRTGQEPEPAE